MSNSNAKILQIIPAPAGLCAEFIDGNNTTHEVAACLALVEIRGKFETWHEVRAMVCDCNGYNLLNYPEEDECFQGLTFKAGVI